MGWFKNAEEKAAIKQKKELIKKYGEDDGMMIFNGKISEKEYLRKKELIEKYGEKDGLRIYENKISEEKYLEEKEKEKKKAAQKKKKAVKQKILDTIAEKDGLNGWFFLNRTLFEYDPEMPTVPDPFISISYFVTKLIKRFEHILIDDKPLLKKKFIQLVKELIEEGQLFTYDTWKGEALPDWIMKYKTEGQIGVFTKSYAEEVISESTK